MAQQLRDASQREAAADKDRHSLRHSLAAANEALAKAQASLQRQTHDMARVQQRADEAAVSAQRYSSSSGVRCV